MEDVTSWVGIVVFGCGLYCLYATIMMKTKGEINRHILLGRDYQFKKCKNKDAYIKEMFPQLCLFSVITTLSGLADIINSFVVEIGIVYFIMLILFVVEFFLFSKTTLKLKKKYY